MKKSKLFIVALAAFSMCLGACGSSEKPSSQSSTSTSDSTSQVDERIYAIYQLYLESGGTQSYEEWLESIKGADGKDGIDGKDGKDGADGVDGKDGADGLSLLSGNTDPSDNLGNDGDKYINTTTWDFFIKINGKWTKVGNMMGGKGPQGEPGKDGEDGKDGQDGQDGQTPYVGENGNWWIGDTDTGVKAQGTDGQDGEDGQDGNTPYIGENGNWWIGDTDTGVKAQGVDGQDGEDGQDGSSVITGHGAPTSELGQDGDSYIDIDTFDYYLKENGLWTLKGNIRGSDGQDGQDGEDGVDGEDGQDGISITSAIIDDNGDLIITYSDGSVVNAGHIKNVEEYTVTYVVDGSVYTTETVAAGNKAHKPENPTKTGYSFLGWYDENDDYWVFNGYTITENITLYARFIANQHTITLDLDGGTCDKNTVYVAYDGAFTLPTPTRTDYYFEGWYYNQELFTSGIYQFDFDITIKAKWSKDYTITFDSKGGTSFDPIVTHNEIIEELPTPIKDGCAFDGWTLNDVVIILPYTNSDYSDLSLVAKWREVSGDYFYSNNGDGTATITGYNGTDVDITIPNLLGGLTVNKIETNVFKGNTTLKSIRLSNNITVVEDEAFENCTSLESIYFNTGLPSDGYGENLLLGCSSLKHISIDCVDFKITQFFDYDEKNMPSNLEVELYYTDNYSLPKDKLFNSLSNIRLDVTLTNGWTFIPSNFFQGSACIKSIIIPNSVTSIGYYAFYNCTSLASIIIPESVTSIGYYAFYNCTSITSITLPDSLTSIGYGAFSNCTSLTSVVLPDSVTSIVDSAFSNCSSLTSITLPESVTSIGGSAFFDCTRLTIVVLPDSLTSIGNSAFYNCTSLGNVFYGGTKKQWNSITVESGNDYLLNANIEYETTRELTYVNDGKYIYTLDNLNNVYGLKALNKDMVTVDFAEDLPGKNIVSLGYRAFYDCTSLTSITLPEGLTSIGSYAFENCTSLTSVVIPDSITSIGYNAFYYCYCLKNVFYGGKKVQWNNIAIAYGNDYLLNANIEYESTKELTYVNDGKYIYILDNQNNVYELKPASKDMVTVDFAEDLPGKNIVSLANNAFSNCTSLSSITLPNSVTSIGDGAFLGCDSLTSIVIPNSVTSIGTHAFYECYNLKAVYYAGTPESWDNIDIQSDGNYYLTNAPRYYYSETEPTDTTYKYWHYVNGAPTAW